jgi:DNA-binding XRE family transcriptional regulator
MKFEGKIYKDGKFWLAEIPILDLMTQGRTKKEAYVMVVDMIESLVNKQGAGVTVHERSKDVFEVGSAEPKYMISLLLKRKREISGLSLEQVAKRLGMASRNAYARYEQGKSIPTIKKLDELFGAVSPGNDLVINEAVHS